MPSDTTGTSSEPTSIPRSAVVALCVLLGLALLAHPLSLFAHHGQVQYHVGNIEPVDDATVSDDETVAYASLPPAAQAAFDAARRDDTDDDSLWTGEDDRAIDALQSHRFVRQDGTAYRYSLGHADEIGVSEGAIRVLLSSTGGLLLALGALVALTGTWPPLSPRRSLVVVATVGLGLFGMQAYDVLYSGATGRVFEPFPTGFALAFCFIGLGSLVRRRGSGVVRPVAVVGLAVLVAGTVAVGAAPIVPVAIAAFALVVGAPLAAVGYSLTAPDRLAR